MNWSAKCKGPGGEIDGVHYAPGFTLVVVIAGTKVLPASFLSLIALLPNQDVSKFFCPDTSWCYPYTHCGHCAHFAMGTL